MVRVVRASGAVAWCVDRRWAGGRSRTFYPTEREAMLASAGPPPTAGRTLADAAAATIDRATARGDTPKHVADLARARDALGPLLGVRLAEITADMVELWDRRRRRGGSTARILVRVRAFVAEAIRQGWIDRDPLRSIAVARRQPDAVSIHTAAQARALIRAAADISPDLERWLGLGYYGGLRPSEACALRWEQVERDRIVVLAAKARSPRVRIVGILPPLARMLGPGGCGPVVAINPWTLYNLRERACRTAGVAWSHDVARHTCASHLLALWRDSARVALHLGHRGTEMLWRHYRAMVPEDEAREYFA